jgi:hypothetical protein
MLRRSNKSIAQRAVGRVKRRKQRTFSFPKSAPFGAGPSYLLVFKGIGEEADYWRYFFGAVIELAPILLIG